MASFPLVDIGNLPLMPANSDMPVNREELLRQARDVEELLRSVPVEIVGARLHRARQRLGLSIRELAAAASLNKNSIVHLEKGGVPQPMTVLKVCAALGIHVASLVKPSPTEAEIVAIHRRSDDRWYDMTNLGAGPVADHPLSEEERRNLAEGGVATPMLMLKNRLETGQMMPDVLELYKESETRSHVGEEMIYVLQGRAAVTVGSQSFELDEGECATFWSAEEHRYAPANGSKLPVRLLSITIHHHRVRPKETE
jgi:transcriptional regulator with XRE-family HTH domain